MEKLGNTFNEIRSCYFPRWDIKKEWTIQGKNRHRREHGLCDWKNKAICVHPRWVQKDDINLYALIIHEICHAVASHYHGKKYRSRLLKVADKAQDIGETDLADKLRSEEKRLQELSFTSRVHHIYCEITDALCYQPDASMDLIFTWVADNNGLAVDELLKRYRKADKVYKRVKKELAEYEALKNIFAGPIKNNANLTQKVDVTAEKAQDLASNASVAQW